ncbi:hypothetical protein BDZ97DRAFT_1761509 [Flammula alnicola]|nr:hypothetical protein BDZ97DRAFT_1761509 [Flammula alnicola]
MSGSVGVRRAAREMIEYLELQQAILEFLPYFRRYMFYGGIKQMSQLLCCIKALDFQDEHRAYNQTLELVTRMAKDWEPDDYRSLGEHHNISQILVKLEFEQQAQGPKPAEKRKKNARERKRRRMGDNCQEAAPAQIVGKGIQDVAQ